MARVDDLIAELAQVIEDSPEQAALVNDLRKQIYRIEHSIPDGVDFNPPETYRPNNIAFSTQEVLVKYVK